MSQTPVAVYTQDFVQVFPLAHVIQVSVREVSKVMEHPLETGATIIDHKITLPVEIDLSLVLDSSDFENTYNLIKQLYLNATLLTVQTKASTYYNQLITSLPHEETTAIFDTITIALKLRQALFITPVVQTPTTNPAVPGPVSPANPTQASTVRRGQTTAGVSTPLPQLPPLPGSNVTPKVSAAQAFADFEAGPK